MKLVLSLAGLLATVDAFVLYCACVIAGREDRRLNNENPKRKEMLDE